MPKLYNKQSGALLGIISDEDIETLIDEIGAQSFPASDPPGWIRASASTSDRIYDDETRASSGPQTRALKRALLGILVGSAVLGSGLLVNRVLQRRRRARCA